MWKRIFNFSVAVLIALLIIVVIWFLQKKGVLFATEFGFALLGCYLPFTFKKCQDFFDTKSWQSDLRKLRRGGELKSNDRLRISFAYLFRIKVDDKYLLVLNNRGTQKYQPVGGAYQFNEEEKIYLSNKFKFSDDEKIKRDELSRNDYRLNVPVKYIRKFIKRFDKTDNREGVNDLSREFKEELIRTGIIDFKNIKYRYCGRHFSKIQYSRHFNCYELLLADIVELELTDEQCYKLRSLMEKKSKLYRFISSKEIKSCGIYEGTNKLIESIGDHTIKILQETEDELLRVKGSLKSYTISLK